MYTLNNIVTDLTNFATIHSQINSFGFGEFYDEESGRLLYGAFPEQSNNSNAPTYPLMWANVDSSNVNGNALFTSIKISIADLVNKNENNATDVLNDMHMICLDIMALFKDRSRYLRFSMQETSTFTPFREGGDDERTGWLINITIKQAMNYKECSVPLKVGSVIDGSINEVQSELPMNPFNVINGSLNSV